MEELQQLETTYGGNTFRYRVGAAFPFSIPGRVGHSFQHNKHTHLLHVVTALRLDQPRGHIYVSRYERKFPFIA